MIRLQGKRPEKMDGIVKTVEEVRQLFHEDDKYVEKKATSRRADPRTVGANVADGGTVNLPNSKGFHTFKKATRLRNCRICKPLESRGDTQGLYENHTGNYATGCPRYFSMTTVERFEVTKESKICLRCLDPKSNWSFRDGCKGCCDNLSRKNRFSCTVQEYK